MQLLTFTFNNVDFGIPVSNVESIESRMNVIKVPNAPEHVTGIMNLHGEIIAVYSLASHFGYGDRPVHNIVVVNIEGMKLGLEIEDVKEIVDVENNGIIPMPQIMNATQNCFNDVASCKKELIVMLDVTMLLPKELREAISKLVADSKGE